MSVARTPPPDSYQTLTQYADGTNWFQVRRVGGWRDRWVFTQEDVSCLLCETKHPDLILTCVRTSR